MKPADMIVDVINVREKKIEKMFKKRSMAKIKEVFKL